MSIKIKIFAALILGILALEVLLYGVQRYIVFPSFLELERDGAERNLERAVRAIQREIHHLDTLCHDWSAWDDTVTFVEDGSEEYVRSNLPDDTFESNRLNLIHFIDKEGKTVWSKAIDLESMQAIDLSSFLPISFPKNHPLALSPDEKIPMADLAVKGVLMLRGKPWLFSSRPILNSDNEGPIKGTFIMGRALEENALEDLKKQTQVDFSLISVAGKSKVNELERILAGFKEGRKYLTEIVMDDHLNIYTTFQDLTGKDSILVKTVFPRKITTYGYSTIKYSFLFFLLAGLLILLIVVIIMQRAVVGPILDLTEHAQSIEAFGDFSSRIGSEWKGEVGVLARAFDRMIERVEKQTVELEQVNQDLKMLSRKDGLTRLYNRRFFDHQLELLVMQMRREKNPLSLIMCDIDHFKQYNDHYGHVAGDDCLKCISSELEEKTRRPFDSATRYGGEEFAILLPNTTREGAEQIAESIRQGVENLEIEHKYSSAGQFVTLSIGVTSMTPNGEVSPGSIVKSADRGLYRAKEEGRNRIVFEAFDEKI